MAAEGFDKFVAANLGIGIDAQRSDFSPTLLWTTGAFNVTSGIQQGIGPRYGMAPIPGQTDNEAPGGTVYPGLMRSETAMANITGGGTTWSRLKVYGCLAYRFRGVGRTGGLGTVSTYYVWFIGYNTSVLAGTFFDAILAATQPIGYVEQASDIRAGIPMAGADAIHQQITSAAIDLSCEKLVIPSVNYVSIAAVTGEQRPVLLSLLKDTFGKNYASIAPFAVSGSDYPQNWFIGGKITAPDATHGPSLNAQYIPGTTYGAVLGGQSSYWPWSGSPDTSRSLKMYCLNAVFGNSDIIYTGSAKASAVYNGSYIENPTDVNIQQLALTKSGAGVGYAGVQSALVNDALNNVNNSYQGALIAAGKAIAVIFQDWYRGCIGEMQQYVDLTSPTLPRPYVGAGFAFTPTFGAAGTGILRQATAYELGVSIYDKRLNFETNVQFINSATTGANDFVNMVLFAGGDTMANQALGGGATPPIYLPMVNTAGSGVAQAAPVHFNYLEYRFYYRAAGMAEWLPALFIDAPKFWFFPFVGGLTMTACNGGIGGVPGGRVGGFSDYSALPPDVYTCAVNYKGRAFWLSDKALYFSSTNNMFAYPGRNSVSCPAGSFRGALVHAYYGQADQDARLVIFSTAGTYVGKFTGNLQQTAVQVSVDTIANFGLDGSDFVVNPWTSITAFSYRSAIVAKGILYLWGPQGVFRDDGVTPVQSLTEDSLEPDIFGFYDPNRTDEIHCTYSDTTKEIIWFYPPKTADGYATHSLVYNTLTKTFLPQRYRGQVDAALQLNVDTNIPTAGSRSVVISRASSAATVQRAYFYDHNNRSGDIFPTGEMMVKQISTPATGLRRLTLAAGFDAVNFATIAAGDFLALTQVARYATSLATPADFLATVAATNAGAGTIDINLPAGVTFDAAAGPLAEGLYFPVWHAAPAAVGINGFSFNVPSKYWVGQGGDYWAQFLYLYWQMKVNLLPNAGAAQTVSFTYRTPISDAGAVTDTLTFQNNSDGNWQLYHPLQIGDQNAEGQGLRFTISGIQIASEWVLQYLELHAMGMDGDQLKVFEQ